MKARLLLIGTHHKTGTLWMRRTWKQVAREQGIPFMPCYRPQRLNQIAETGPHILVNWSSRFPGALLAREDIRVLHVIRDPRDVLISGMRYHRTAPLGNEKFLRERRKAWNGMTYQEYLNRLPDDRARLRFEMNEKHAATVLEMLDWQDIPGISLTLRYEDLISDPECNLLRQTLETFAITGLDVEGAVQAFWENALFGGLRDRLPEDRRLRRHVNNGSPAQWRTRMPPDVAQLYAQCFQAALDHLGYATSGDWVRECAYKREEAPPFRLSSIPDQGVTNSDPGTDCAQSSLL